MTMAKYYKIVTIIICTLFYLQDLSAQVDSVKLLQIKNRAIDSICICISKTDTNSVNTVNDAQIMLTRCITDNTVYLIMDYAKAAGYDTSNISDEKFQEIVNYIAAEVYGKCTAMKIMVNHVQSMKKPN
jgi:hypothetical protein